MPAARKRPGRSSPRRLWEAVAVAERVAEQVEDILDLRLIVVRTDEQMRIWNELMIREYPRGAGPLVGRQLRYLIGSQHG